jgi:acyl dehydratase
MSPTVGEELPPFTDKPLTVTDFVRYQGASGDMNPIHHDTEFAQHSGFPTPFAVGMLQAGVLATYLTDRFGASAIRRFKVQWKEQAWPGDVLTYSAVVVGTRHEDGQSLVDLEASVTRQTGGVHLLGWATFVVQ